ncbi:MAG TPA: HAMP domain-containing sensor histidine kinase [Ideonella sp.]|uniref:sensor histidine kinase n=1 Tax=Ideonella sp. TaxID=1929293 RepID=UPI002E2EE9E5|nr:HAMP domain-containing sensor histidine kinase [Ideonella sp.]HEX5687101.1 HAMP domain-containing sensor histidine kinase [Ideonella sp.]
MQVLINRFSFPFKARLHWPWSTRGAEVAQLRAELAQARGAAAAAKSARHACITRTTHELRTPLNAVLGYAQLLHMEAGLTARQSQHLRIIEQAGHHMLALVDDILTLSCQEAGTFLLHDEPLRLSSFLDNVTDLVRPQAAQKRLVLRLDAPSWPHAVKVDAQRLCQVLLNLLANAVRFTDDGEVVLRVRATAGPAGMARLQFEVADTGLGIAPQDLPQLFRPFHQVGDAARHAGGTGLGLAISRQLVRAMGAEIEVRSALGHGTTFTFTLDLPLVAPAAMQPAPDRGAEATHDA